MTSFSASSFVEWAVWPSCQRNSRVLRNGFACLNSHLTTEFHWLSNNGRALQLLIHFAKLSILTVSDVGLIASLSFSWLFPPWVTHATSGVKPSKCFASFFNKLSGMKIGK